MSLLNVSVISKTERNISEFMVMNGPQNTKEKKKKKKKREKKKNKYSNCKYKDISTLSQ